MADPVGRPAKPTKLKILEGNPGHRPIPDAPEPRPGLPVKPAGMEPAAEKLWDRLIADYGATGVLTGVDAEPLRVYCEAVVRYERSAQALAASGPLIKGRDQAFVKNPLHQVVRDNADLIRMFARELGFTPSSRSALADVKGPKPDDELGAWAAS